MAFTGLRPENSTTTVKVRKKPSDLRDEFQHVLGVAVDDCVLKNDDGTYGGKFTPTDLNLSIFPFRGIIGKKYHSATSAASVTLGARKASYIYASKNAADNNITPAFGKYEGVYPAADGNTVLRYVFNEASGQILDSSTNLNNGIVNGAITRQVDGWADYAIRGDGSTGYITSTNSGGFPAAALEREADVVFIHVPKDQYIFVYGTDTASNTFFALNIGVNNIIMVQFNNQTSFNTGYELEPFKVYFLSVHYDGVSASLYVNGILVWSAAVTLNTGSGNLYVGKYITNIAKYSKSIMCYFELRNKVRTPQQIAQISNKLCLPCHYTGYSASYPANDTTSGAHIYKFDDVSGTTVTDELGTLNGIATGTTIADSEIGLGKARKFNGASDKITLGSFAFPTQFTVVYCGKPTLSNYHYLFSNRDAGNTIGYSIYINQTGKLQIDNTSQHVGAGSVASGALCFEALTFSNGMAIFYENSPNITAIFTGIALRNNAGTLSIGYDSIGGFSAGTYEYCALIPRALSQAEIVQYYNTLMVQKERTLIDDCLPSNSISLGFVRTGSSALIEYNDTDYKYMRNEGATKAEGNKRVFLGWKYFSGQTMLTWDNPFGTRKIKTYYTWAQDANGANESDVEAYYYNTSLYGVQFQPSTSSRIRIITATNGVVYFNGVWQTSGYIGCYAEVL